MCFRRSSITTDSVDAALDLEFPRFSIETPASTENVIQSEVSHVEAASEQLAVETGSAANDEMRTDDLPTLENISYKIDDFLDKEPTTESEIMTSKPEEVNHLVDSFDQQSLVNMTVESQSTADVVLKPDEVTSETELLVEKTTDVILDEKAATDEAPKSPPIISKASYAIDWDNFDESANPFEPRVRLGNSPSGGSGKKAPSDEALNPFKSSKILQLSPRPSSKNFGFTSTGNKAKEVDSSSNVENDVKQDNFSASSSDAIKSVSTNESTKTDCKASDNAARYVY